MNTDQTLIIIIPQRQLILIHLHLSKQEQKLCNIHNSHLADDVEYNVIDSAGKKRKNICVVYSRFHLLLPVPYVFALSVLRSLFFFFLLFQIFMYNLLFFSLIRWRVNGICSLINHQRPTAELRRWWWWQGHRDISANNYHFKLGNHTRHTYDTNTYQ